jgi:hypothetical protein
MARRTHLVSFGSIDVKSDNGEVIGLVLSGSNDEGPMELVFSPEAARHFLRAIGVFAQTIPEV